ncbi:hypothetical protein [Chitinophaga pinensis]|uniref:Uncharacterized protein n=1 Tax=Chitinophaga pinensis (strain ATCC 43595 / DSM 2588 / LMG 13176 / NBRC 15968 / NCIMB 11800 / UQM 2034) TaxID=485918 RepID=A0A979FYM9_CHIPD|nr:hypothetical protein [Chitinophaga pinensis]ACU57537.1 hypothetical protein Cpin_0028 [Chitinophaga pinensis DSM 2588]
MSFMNFNRNTPSLNGTNSEDVTASVNSQHPEIPENIFIDTNLTPAKTGLEREEKIDNNIDLLFRFLDRNLENQGYEDALINPDITNLNENIASIKNDLHRTIKKVNIFYDSFIREINFHIDSRSRSGMIDTVEELIMKKQIAEDHVQKIQDIEIDAKNGQGDSQGLILSYTRGFKNGLAAISHHNIIRKKL